MSNLSADKGIPVKFCWHPTHLERSSEKEFSLSTAQNDKNSLWVGLNIRKPEWYVKQKSTRWWGLSEAIRGRA